MSGKKSGHISPKIFYPPVAMSKIECRTIIAILSAVRHATAKQLATAA
jgi:hypothetical protein